MPLDLMIVYLNTFEPPCGCQIHHLKHHKKNLAGEGYTPTWCEEAVEVTDDGAERGPECRLIVHAAGDQVSQLGPLWCRKMMVILIKQDFL